MKTTNSLTAIEKRAQNQDALAPFALHELVRKLPLVLSLGPNVPPSPKTRYRSAYRYLGWDDLNEESLEVFSPFEISVRLFDFSPLEHLLAAHIYAPSARGQTPFHPVSLYLLSLYRREHHHSRQEVLRILRNSEEGKILRRCTGLQEEFPAESGLRYFEGKLTPELQQEINALQLDALYQAGLLPVKPDANPPTKVALSFDGMLHHARSRQRCTSVKEGCYEPAPRPCPAKDKGKRGCECDDDRCTHICRHAPSRDPQARFIVYSGRNKQASTSPNTPVQTSGQRSASRKVYGYYSYAGQLLDDKLATYWVLPAAFGPATQGDPALFPPNFAYLQARFFWLQVGEVLADAGACEQTCLDAIWEAGALRMVDIRAHQSDKASDTQLARGYDEDGHPLCPFGYLLHSNGYDYQRRRTKWRCGRRCLRLSKKPIPSCPYLHNSSKHGYTTTVGRTHADGSTRLAREIPYGSKAWKARYGRRNSAESRNSILERLGLKRMPVHGLPASHVVILQADFIANQHTLIRLVRQAAAFG